MGEASGASRDGELTMLQVDIGILGEAEGVRGRLEEQQATAHCQHPVLALDQTREVVVDAEYRPEQRLMHVTEPGCGLVSLGNEVRRCRACSEADVRRLLRQDLGFGG